MNIDFPYASLQPFATAASPNYAERRRENIVGAVPRLAFDGLDVYLGATRTLADLGETAQGLVGAGVVVAALGHSVSALYHFGNAGEADDLTGARYRAIGTGELVTALGFVGAAAGMGPWALPLIGVGMLTANFATFR